MIKKNHITAAALAGAMIFSMIPAGSAFAKTSYTYKPLNEAVYYKNSDTGKWYHSYTYKYTYDKKGRPLTSKGKFSKWSYSYGKKSITFKQSYNDGGNDEYRKVYSLKKNRIDKATETDGGTILTVDKYSYNSKGLNTKISHYVKDNELLYTITMTYNAKKQMTKRVTKYSGSNSLETELFTYNKSGQIISEVHTRKTKTSTKTSTTKTTYYKSGKAKGLIASRTCTETDGSKDEKWRYTFKKVGGKYYIASEIGSSRLDDDPFTDQYKFVYSNFKKMPVYSDPYHVFE